MKVNFINTREILDVFSYIVSLCRKYDTKPCEKKYAFYRSWIRQLRHEIRIGENIQTDLDQLGQELEAYAMQIEKESKLEIISVAIQNVRFKRLTKYCTKRIFLENSLKFLEKQGFSTNKIELQPKDDQTYIKIHLSPILSKIQWGEKDEPSEEKILSLVVDLKGTIKKMEFITSFFAEKKYKYSQELWEDEDIKKAEYILSLITGKAWIENDPLGFILKMLTEFSNQVPGSGFEIAYLEEAAELYDLYGQLVGIMESEEDITNKKYNDKTEEMQTIKDIAYKIKDIVL